MDQELEETLSAALDGEPVDLGQLREALGTTAGREVLAGFLLVRAAASASVGEPDDALKVDVQKVARPRWFMAGPQVPARLAASLAAMVVGGALWLGLSVRGVPAESPVPLRSQTATMKAPPAPAPAVAKPARMLQFEGWREGS